MTVERAGDSAHGLRLDLSAAPGIDRRQADRANRLPFAPGDATSGENALRVLLVRRRAPSPCRLNT